MAAHIDREIAARPDLVQIENGFLSPKDRKLGAIQLAHVRVIETVVENPDAEPDLPCAAARTALIVYGKRIGTTLTVCTDRDCPVHDPHAAAARAANPAPVMAPAPEQETEEEAAEREREYEQRRKEYEEEQQRKEEERQQQFQKEQKEREAQRARMEKVQKARQATFERILEHAPAMFSAPQLRTFLSALINLDPYVFEEVAENCIGDDENNQKSAEEILASALADDNCASPFPHRTHRHSKRRTIRYAGRSRSRLRSLTTQEEQQAEEGEGSYTCERNTQESEEARSGGNSSEGQKISLDRYGSPLRSLRQQAPFCALPRGNFSLYVHIQRRGPIIFLQEHYFFYGLF